MGKLAADSAAVSLNDDSFQPAAPVNSFVGMEHFLITDFDAGIVDIEAIKVFHHELTQAHQTILDTREHLQALMEQFEAANDGEFWCLFRGEPADA